MFSRLCHVWCHLFGCRFAGFPPAVTLTASEVPHAATPPKWVHWDHPATISGIAEYPQPLKYSASAQNTWQPQSSGSDSVCQFSNCPAAGESLQRAPSCLKWGLWSHTTPWWGCLLYQMCSPEGKTSQPSCHVDLPLWRAQTCSQHGQPLLPETFQQWGGRAANLLKSTPGDPAGCPQTASETLLISPLEYWAPFIFVFWVTKVLQGLRKISSSRYCSEWKLLISEGWLILLWCFFSFCVVLVFFSF